MNEHVAERPMPGVKVEDLNDPVVSIRFSELLEMKTELEKVGIQLNAALKALRDPLDDLRRRIEVHPERR